MSGHFLEAVVLLLGHSYFCLPFHVVEGTDLNKACGPLSRQHVAVPGEPVIVRKTSISIFHPQVYSLTHGVRCPILGSDFKARDTSSSGGSRERSLRLGIGQARVKFIPI